MKPERKQPPRSITINHVLNGYQVDVGCQRIVFSNLEVMIGELRRYLTDPKEVEFEYLKNSYYAVGVCQPETANQPPPVVVPTRLTDIGAFAASEATTR